MRVLYASDLHGIPELYRDLLALATERRVRAVILGGDLLPLQGPFYQTIREQESFTRSFLVPEFHRFLARNPQARLYLLQGNTDWQGSREPLARLTQPRRVILIHGLCSRLGSGHELIGYGHVPPTPFVIKDGERRDLRADPVPAQRTTPCRSVGERIVVTDVHDHFAGNPSIEEELAELPRPSLCRKAVYAIHSPPYDGTLDVLDDGRAVGSRAVRAFLLRHQPLLGLHGHIHEAPEVSGAYAARLGRTLCINPGQSTRELHAVHLDLEEVASTLEHTVFGRWTQAGGAIAEALRE
jgi:Icc-related predicted phosphoesterase